ncbi:MAG: hypothetical protein ACYCOU_10110 [Sulfobacillus sp.]
MDALELNQSTIKTRGRLSDDELSAVIAAVLAHKRENPSERILLSVNPSSSSNPKPMEPQQSHPKPMESPEIPCWDRFSFGLDQLPHYVEVICPIGSRLAHKITDLIHDP